MYIYVKQFRNWYAVDSSNPLLKSFTCCIPLVRFHQVIISVDQLFTSSLHKIILVNVCVIAYFCHLPDTIIKLIPIIVPNISATDTSKNMLFSEIHSHVSWLLWHYWIIHVCSWIQCISEICTCAHVKLNGLSMNVSTHTCMSLWTICGCP